MSSKRHRPETQGGIPEGGATSGVGDVELHPSSRPLVRSLTRIFKDPWAVGALVVLGVVALMALVSLVWTPFDPNQQAVGPIRQAVPSWSHWLGTDNLGRDTFSRLMVGTRSSILTGSQVIAGALLISVPFGLVSGYFGGQTDYIMMRILDAFTSVPTLVVAVVIAGLLGPGRRNTVIALIIVLIPAFTRVVRAQALSVTATSYVSASKAMGTSLPRILTTRVFPGVLPALIVQISLSVGRVIVAEAALNFLGLGLVPPQASWGSMLRRAYNDLYIAPGLILAPALMISMCVLAVNLLGDSLRDSIGVGTSLRRGRWRRTRLGVTAIERTARRSASATVESSRSLGDDDALLTVADLSVSVQTPTGTLEVIRDVGFTLRSGEVLAMVGESGSGKSVTALSMLRLFPSPPGVITGGSVTLDGLDVMHSSMSDLRGIRGKEMAMVFQDPMASLDPTFTIGNSVVEAIRNHTELSGSAARRRAVELLGRVGIPSPAKRLDDYPHEFSGGMRQRVLIAMALAGEPRVLIADEPTTALDVTVQAQILELLSNLCRDLGMALLIVTHDMGVVADIADRVVVMYAGEIVEEGSVHAIFEAPQHPYTAGLLASATQMGASRHRSVALPGTVPSLGAMPSGCRFHPRCEFAIADCRDQQPPLTRSSGGGWNRCIRADDLELRGQQNGE